MVISVDSYFKKRSKKNLSEYSLYLLCIDRNSEIYIINEILKHTRYFLLLSTQEIESLDFTYTKIYANERDVEGIISNIMSDSVIIDGNSGNETKDYILLWKRNCKVDNYFEDAITFSIIINKLKSFDLCELFFTNSYAVTRFSDNTQMKLNTKIKIFKDNFENQNEIVILTPVQGIGDFFLLFTYIYELKIKNQYDNNVYLAIIENNNSLLSLYKSIFDDDKILYFNSVNMFDKCFKSHYENVIQIIPKTTGHVSDYAKRLVDCNPYKNNNIFIDFFLKNIDEKDKNDIDNFFDNNDWIGFQYFSGYYDSQEDIWVTRDFERNWKEDNVTEFLRLCNNAGLKLLILNENIYNNSTNFPFIMKMPILSFIYTISKLKYFVGIDSLVGHIASFFDIPNITLWGKDSPTIFHNYKVSYRPLRNNTSIVPRSKNIGGIDANDVLKILLQKLPNCNLSGDDIITYYDSEQEKDIFFV